MESGPCDALEISMLSIRKLAALCGVAPMTVSKALRGAPGVSEKTRARIVAMAEKHRFRPNYSAQGVFQGKTKLIGVIVSDMSREAIARRLSATADFLISHGFSTLVYNTFDRIEVESKCFSECINHRVAGVISQTANFDANEDFYQELRQREIPVVLVSVYAQGVRIPHVHSDERAMGAKMAEYLISLGHRRIGIVTGPALAEGGNPRLDGMLAALEAHGLRHDPALQVTSDWDYIRARMACDRLLDANRVPPTAIIAFNDLIAMGVMESLRGRGLRVPDDVSVCGFGNLFFGKTCLPALTTMDERHEEIGRRSAEILFELIKLEAARKTPGHLLECSIPTDLIVRQSTARPPRPATRSRKAVP
jgi:LacI family transcriptional regulator